MIKKTGDALFDLSSPSDKPSNFWIEKPSQLENRRKAIVDDREWRADFLRSAPGEIKKDLPLGHQRSLK